MKENRRKGKFPVEDVQEDYEKCIQELAEIVSEGLKDQHTTSLEPFDIYADRVRSKIHANMDTFKSRFVKGYEVLLEELNKEIPNSEKGTDTIRP